MNERIKELFEKCVYEKEFGFDVEMFAQLIVRECISRCDDLNSQQYIMQHFGMKESDWK